MAGAGEDDGDGRAHAGPLARFVRSVRALRGLGPLALFLVVAPAAGATALVATAGRWLPPLEALGVEALPWFVAASVLLAGLSLVPTHAVSLVAGMLFGGAVGFGVALLAITAAALLGYLLLRAVTGDRWVRALEHRRRARAVHAATLGRGGWRAAGLIALVRLSPVMPFAGTNLLMAMSGVGPGAFTLGSAAGLAPRVGIVSFAGAGLSQLDLSRGADLRLAVLGLVATVAVLAITTRIAQRALRAAQQSSNAPD